QVFHEVAAGRRALDNRLWPAACCLTPLTILCGCPGYQREQTRECDKRKLGQPRNQPEHCHHAGRNPQRTRTSAYLPGESCTHLRTTGHVRDHDAGRGGDDQRGDLRYESVSNRDDRVARSSFAERHTALYNTHENPANDIDGSDQKAGYGISLHELGRTVHRTVEVRLTRYLVAPPAGFIFIYETCREVGIDRHLLARHCIERETGCYLGHTPGTLRDDDEIDAHKDDEDHQSHGEIATHHELAERLNHRACMSFGEYESGTAHVQGKPEEGEQEQQRGKAAEIQWIGGLQCHQQNHYGDAD